MAIAEVRQRERICKHCKTTFTYPVGKGSDRQHCSEECRLAYQASRRLPKDQWPICSTDGCERHTRSATAKVCWPCYKAEAKRRAGVCQVQKCTAPATRVGHGLCEKHYGRIRRLGTFEVQPRVMLQVVGGYIQIKDADHPLAQVSNGWVFQHRAVAYEKYGPGPHPCHWCGAVHEWPDLVVDHLNEQKADNRPENLVVACNPCNRMRGGMIPFIKRMLPERLSEFIATFEHMRAEPAVSKEWHDSEAQAMERRA